MEPNALTTCNRCGCTSPLGGLFRTVRGQPLCPRCFERRENTGRLRQVQAYVLYALIAAILAWLSVQIGISPWPWFNIMLCYTLVYLLILPHELAHGLVALALGGRLLELRIGAGPQVAATRLGKTLVTLRRYPITGVCMIDSDIDAPGWRRRTALSIAAGPVFNLLVCLATLPGLSAAHFETGPAWREALFAASLITLLSNALMRSTSVDGLTMQTDIAHLWRILRQPAPAPGLRQGYALYDAAYAYQRHDMARLAATSEDALARWPGQPIFASYRAVAALETGRLAEARQRFEALEVDLAARAETTGAAPVDTCFLRALNWNNLAYTLLLEDHARGRAPDRACELARRAYAWLPWVPAVQATLGAVLIETGSIEEGLALVQGARGAPGSERRDEAARAAWMAAGCARLGDEARSRRLLAEAERLLGGSDDNDSASRVLARARERVLGRG